MILKPLPTLNKRIIISFMEKLSPEQILISTTKSKRKSISISAELGELKVKAPMNMSDAEVVRFVQEHSKWINEKLAKGTAEKSKFTALFNLEYLMISGQIVRSTDVIKDRKITKKSVKDFYLSRLDYIIKFGYERAMHYGLNVKEILPTNAKTFWGLCTSENIIKLNYRLVMLPDSLVTYVVLHELAHTICHNHSKKFWDTLAGMLPDCKSRRKQLKDYSWLMYTYRK